MSEEKSLEKLADEGPKYENACKRGPDCNDCNSRLPPVWKRLFSKEGLKTVTVPGYSFALLYEDWKHFGIKTALSGIPDALLFEMFKGAGYYIAASLLLDKLNK